MTIVENAKEQEAANTLLPVPNSQAFWEKHFSMNNWWLMKPYFKLGRYWGDDKTGNNCYGWVNEITYGPDKGKFAAGHPYYYEEDDGSDAISIGVFETLELGMAAIIESNHPDYSGIYC